MLYITRQRSRAFRNERARYVETVSATHKHMRTIKQTKIYYTCSWVTIMLLSYNWTLYLFMFTRSLFFHFRFLLPTFALLRPIKTTTKKGAANETAIGERSTSECHCTRSLITGFGLRSFFFVLALLLTHLNICNWKLPFERDFLSCKLRPCLSFTICSRTNVWHLHQLFWLQIHWHCAPNATFFHNFSFCTYFVLISHSLFRSCWQFANHQSQRIFRT